MTSQGDHRYFRKGGSKVGHWVYRFIFQAAFIAMVCTPFVRAEDVSGGDQGVERNGVVFNIAEDRQIENIGGTYEPEGLDKYFKRRFDQLSGVVERLEAQVTAMDKKITVIQETLTARQQTDTASGTQKPASKS